MLERRGATMGGHGRMEKLSTKKSIIYHPEGEGPGSSCTGGKKNKGTRWGEKPSKKNGGVKEGGKGRGGELRTRRKIQRNLAIKECFS